MQKEPDKKPLDIKTTVITAMISTVITILGSVLLLYITRQEPTLKYEILPLSYFKTDSLHITIVNIRIVNEGNKECESIFFAPHFGDSLNSTDYEFQKSSPTIQMQKQIDSFSRKSYFFVPFLNAKEQVLCSFLLNKIIDEKSIDVDLRSKGNIGVKIEPNSPTIITRALYFGTIGMMALTIGLVVFIIFHQRKVIRYQLRLQRLSSEQFKRVLAKHGIDWPPAKKEL